MRVEEIEKTSETHIVEGIRLPYSVKRSGRNRPDYVETGEVFVSYEDLAAVQEQRRYDSDFGVVLLLGYLEGRALEQAGLAVRETRGGYHRPDDDKLKDLLKRLWGGRSE